MARYTKLKLESLQEIAGQYDLAILNFAPIEGGASNSSYTLQTGQGDYVLTVFDDKIRADVIKLERLLTQLEKWSFPTTRLRLSFDGCAITMFQDKTILLKPFIAGEVCTPLDEAMLTQVGQALATLHQVPAPVFLPDKHPYGYQVFASVIGQKIHPIYESWLAEQLIHLVKHIPPNLPRTLIHGDLFFDNVLFEHRTFRAIIDFEEACRYFRIFDLGMGVVGLCTWGATVQLDKARAFIQGYQQGQQLETCEKEALQLFVEYAATATSYWRFWKYYIDMPQPEKANKPFEMKHLAEAIRAFPRANFLTQIFN